MRSQFADVPYNLSNSEIAAERQALLAGNHMAHLNAFVEEKRIGLGKGMPYFDPMDAGENASLLLVLESPGPKAVGSNFVSRNNPDPTARNTFQALQSSGLPRSVTALWNVVPWNVSSVKANSRPNRAEILKGSELLLQVIKLMPNLQCIVLCGRLAWHAESGIREVCRSRVIKTYHFANRSFNHTRLREHILNALADARKVVRGQELERPDSVPVSNTRPSESVGRRAGYSIEDHLSRTDARRRAIFEELRSRIVALNSSVGEKAVKILVGYRVKLNFAEIHFLADRLKVHLRPKDYVDPRGYVERLENPGFTMDRRFYLSEEGDLDYAFELIRQSYQDVADR